MQVLVVNPPEHTLPDGTTDLLGSIGWDITPADSYVAAVDAAGSRSIDAVILAAPDAPPSRSPNTSTSSTNADFAKLLRLIEDRRIATVLLSSRKQVVAPSSRSLISAVDRDISLPELKGRLVMIERYHGMLTAMDRELSNMQRLGTRLKHHFAEVDQQMQLAGRLQRDFLPDLSEPIRNIQFASVYRPASWVSGDLFDVFRVDDDVTAFYLVDAVGHGMAASLLTMFIKRAIISKRIDGDDYSILTPSETMTALNKTLVEQSLPNCQFVTACYGLINHKTLTMHYARGGHPYPILLPESGTMEELKTQGGLLGIFDEEEFPTFETQLHPGDKIVLYTDGIELAFPELAAAEGKPDARQGMPDARPPYYAVIASLRSRPIQEMLQEFERQIDTHAGSLAPTDDITLLGFDVLDM